MNGNGEGNNTKTHDINDNDCVAVPNVMVSPYDISDNDCVAVPDVTVSPYPPVVDTSWSKDYVWTPPPNSRIGRSDFRRHKQLWN
jgi:hypothetical protein